MSSSPAVRSLQPIDVVELFPEMHEQLIALLSRLTENDWGRPTICPGWSVKDAALHLLGVDVGNLSVQRDGFIDPWWMSAGGDVIANLNTWNERWVETARRISPRLLCDLLAFTGETASRYFASLDLMAPGPAVWWAGPDPASMWLHVAREYTERWVHQQQIRDAVGRPGLKEPRYLAPVLRAFVYALPRALQPVNANEGTLLRLVVAGEAGGRWVAVKAADRWVLGEDEDQLATATVTIDQDVAWRLWTRGLTADEARPPIRAEGDPELTGRVREMVSIMA